MEKNIGISAKAPAKDCGSRKCPWHGHLKIRGRIFRGRVASKKSLNTVLVEWDYYNFVPKYERHERNKTKVAAHNPACMDIKAGDMVRIAECRALSKTKSFVVVEKVF